MAFLPESDWRYPCKRSCGPDGRRVAEETKASIRYTALTGHEPKPIPMYLTRPERLESHIGAQVMANSRSWFRDHAEQKWDEPLLGKHMGPERRHMQPSPIVTPESVTSISGCVRRLGPNEIPQDRLAAIWSEGRDRVRREFAAKMSVTPSPIPYQNPPSRLMPLRVGTRPVPEHSNMYTSGKTPNQNCILGFKGLGNQVEVPPKRTSAPPGHAVPFNELPFMGQRKPLYAGDMLSTNPRT